MQPLFAKSTNANNNKYTETLIAQINSANNITADNYVDVELVLAVDVSSSVNEREFKLQRDGYVEAFESREVKNAIKQLPNGLAVTVMFWASNRNEPGRNSVHNIGWYKLAKNGNKIDGLSSFVNRIEGVQRRNYQNQNHKVDGQKMQSGTDLASAIAESQYLIDNNNYEGLAKVIDVSGDGLADDTPIEQVDVDYIDDYIRDNNLNIRNYLKRTDGSNRSNCGRGHYGAKEISNEIAIKQVFCPPVLRARDAAVNAGITINGLPIVAVDRTDDAQRNREDEVDKFYLHNVIGGDGAFVERATFDSFADAVKNKISREVTDAALKIQDTDGDGINDFTELRTDIDGDGVFDTDVDGDLIPNHLDTDSDGDGIDDIEEGVEDPDGDDVANYLDRDSDGDGIDDDQENNDSDNDGIPDGIEGTSDHDGDNVANYLDPDSDNDTIPDSVEAGSDPTNPVDTDGDSEPDYIDTDSDNDTIPDSVEVGDNKSTPLDTDGDSEPDYRDTDSDNDTVADSVEVGNDVNAPVNSDGLDFPDYRDADSDNDTILDKDEQQSDYDGDGTPDATENDFTNGGTIEDVDGDGTPNRLDKESDGDGMDDRSEVEGETNPYVKDVYSD